MCEYKSKIAVIIPALDPDEKMISLVRELHGAGFENIIMVDDGSKIENRHYFKSCKDAYHCHLIRHVVN